MVNIIIPCYKARDTLHTALDSLIAQTKKLFWVTIVNDCDGIDYSDIIEEYERRGLHITYIQRERNEGPGLARQAGIDASDRFDYLMFMDADDMLMPRAVEVLYREAKMKGYDVVVSNFYEERACADRQEYGTAQVPNATWMHGKIYRTTYLKEKNIRFSPLFFYNEDSYFNAIALNCTTHKARIDEITYLWRNNKNSVTRSTTRREFILGFYPGYITGQVEACLKIKQEMGTVGEEYLCFVIKAIYAACETIAALSPNKTYICTEVLRLRDLPEIEKIINGRNFEKIVYMDAKQGAIVEDVFYPFSTNIKEWVETYLK